MPGRMEIQSRDSQKCRKEVINLDTIRSLTSWIVVTLAAPVIERKFPTLFPSLESFLDNDWKNCWNDNDSSNVDTVWWVIRLVSELYRFSGIIEFGTNALHSTRTLQKVPMKISDFRYSFNTVFADPGGLLHCSIHSSTSGQWLAYHDDTKLQIMVWPEVIHSHRLTNTLNDSHGFTDAFNEAVVKLLTELDNILTNRSDHTNWALRCASNTYHEAKVKLLLEHGNMLKIRYDHPKWNTESDTLLDVVAISLLKHDDLLKIRSDRKHWTVSYMLNIGHEVVAKLVTKQDNTLTHRSDHTNGAVYYALNTDHEAKEKLLREQGNVFKIRYDHPNWTLLDCAADHGHETIVNLLLEQSNTLENIYDHALNYCSGQHQVEKSALSLPPITLLVLDALDEVSRMTDTFVDTFLRFSRREIWWRSKNGLLLGSGSLRQVNPISSSKTLNRLHQVLKPLLRFRHRVKRRPDWCSLLALPFMFTWATPATAELSVSDKMGTSMKPRKSWAYVQEFLLVSVFPQERNSFANEGFRN